MLSTFTVAHETRNFNLSLIFRHYFIIHIIEKAENNNILYIYTIHRKNIENIHFLRKIYLFHMYYSFIQFFVRPLGLLYINPTYRATNDDHLHVNIITNLDYMNLYYRVYYK